jgi:CheY-like chemotaxis protein
VSLVFLAGSAAVADPEDIIQSLQSLAEMQGWPALRELEFRSVEDLRKVIAAHRREAAPGRPKLIACHGRWPGLDEIAVLDGMKELRDSANPVRIAFIGTAVEQTCGRASAEAVRLLKANMVDLIPWDSEAINHWLLRHARNCAEEVGFAQRVRDETGGFAVVFDEVVLPKGGVNSAAELLDRLAATAEKVLDLGAIGLSHPPLLALARKLAEFDDENGLTDGDVSDLASEIDIGDGIAALTALRNLGLIVQVQTAGEPHWRLLHRLRKIVMKAL